MQLSIVTTLYHSEKTIKKFYEKSLKAIQNIEIGKYEFIFVDDGSPDQSLEEALKLYQQDSQVKVVQLSRNFGHHKAIMTGLMHAVGEYIFLIDSDLEEDPELLNVFWNEIHKKENKDVDVIYGVQDKRKGDWFERISGVWFYKIFNWISDQAKIEKNFLTVRIMRNIYIQEIVKFQDQEFYFSPICNLTGFKQRPITIKKKNISPTTYHFLLKYNALINCVLSFSLRPLFMIFYLGILITLLSFFFGLYIIGRKIFFGINAEGWTSIMISIWLLGGIIILFLGIMSIYISKVFTETKKRPFTVIKKIWCVK